MCAGKLQAPGEVSRVALGLGAVLFFAICVTLSESVLDAGVPRLVHVPVGDALASAFLYVEALGVRVNL